MKKLIFTLTFALLVLGSQAQVFQQGTNIINVGIGFGTSLAGSGSARPAISASFEHGMWDVGGPGVISLGGYIGNTGYKYNFGGMKQSWNYTIIGLRSAYHYNGFTDAPNLDVYGGAMLSYNFVKLSGVLGSSASSGDIGLNAFVGGRYMFSEKFGAFAELGYGISTLNVGVAFKLN